MSDLAGVIAQIKKSTSFLITAHVSPDGDALGSQLALMLALKKMNKAVTLQNADPVPEIYRFLPQAETIKIGRAVTGSYDAYVVLDSEPARTGLFDAGIPGGALINIDHHVTNPVTWQHTWLDPAASATGEMVYAVIQGLGVPLDRDIALCLYTAIFTDTGSFRYTNTTPQCMRVAAALLEAGADPWLVTEHVYESLAYRRLKLLGVLLAGIERSPDEKIAWVAVTDELYRQTGTTAEDTDNLINFVRSVKGVEVAVLFRQTAAAQFKISLRSKGRVDLSGLAQSFGGGGHKNAAGGMMNGTLDEVKKRVVSDIADLITARFGSKDDSGHGRRS